MIFAYGVANLLQSIAAARTDPHHTFNPRLLLRLGRHKIYLVGLVCQFAGFLLAFLARRDLPLFLVQSAVAAGLGVTTLVIAARPAPSRQLGTAGIIGLAIAAAAIAVAGFFAVRLHGAPGSVAL